MLYCKQGKDVTGSNKIGFLDYLLFISSDSGDGKKVKSKLRAPFFSGSSLDVGQVNSEVDNFIKKLSKGTTDYFIDFNKIQDECGEIAKEELKYYTDSVNPIIEEIKDLQSKKPVNEKSLSKKLTSIVKQIAADLKKKITNLVASACPDKSLRRAVTQCALCQANIDILINTYKSDGPLFDDCTRNWLEILGSILGIAFVVGLGIIIVIEFWPIVVFILIVAGVIAFLTAPFYL